VSELTKHSIASIEPCSSWICRLSGSLSSIASVSW
jgi:hypothetical protein